MMFKKIVYAFSLLILVVLASCGGGGGSSSSSKNITAFSFTQGTGVITQGDTAGTIAVTVPYETALTALVATFTTTGSSVTVDGVTQVSGTTPNNFTSAVTYTVTASDGTTKDYTVTVTVADPSPDATLRLSSVVKGVVLDSLGVPGVNIDVFGEPGTTSQMGRVILSLTQASDTASLETLFVPTNSGATVEKVVKAAKGMMPTFTDPAYADEAFSYDESLGVKVTAQDGVTTLVYWFSVEILYEVGDIGPAGGLVFYVDLGCIPAFSGDCFRFLEAAPSDQTTLGVPTVTSWGCNTTTITGAAGEDFGTGQQNTMDILAECGTADIAAKLCNDLVAGGYNDWYLPSVDELNEMYTALHLHVPPLGDFEHDILGDSYWSSTQDSESDAYNQMFFNGNQGTEDKSYTGSSVRAVRAFY